MSQENVELVERLMTEAHENPAVLFDLIHEEARWESGPLEIPDGPSLYRGPAGVREFMRRWVGTFDAWDYESGELIDAGEAVVFHLRQWGTGKGSGVPVSNDFWQAWTFRDGRVIHRTRHASRREALEAVGLSE